MKLLMKAVSCLLVFTILMTIAPISILAEESDDYYTVTIEPFNYDLTYHDFAQYFDIEAEVNGQPVEFDGSSFTFQDFTDVITIRAKLKEEWHNFPCHVTGITMTYDTDDGPQSQDLDLDIINEYRDVETEFQHDGDVHISFNVEKIYKVLIQESDDGIITTDRYRAKEGDRVQLSITPTNPDKPDYNLFVTNERGYEIEVNDDLSFIMTGGDMNVIVEVQFYKKPPFVCSYMYRWWDDETNQVRSEEQYLSEADGVVSMSSVSNGGTLQDGKWYYVDKNVTFSRRIYTNGTVNIVLGDGCTVNFENGIEVNDFNTLNVYDQKGGTGKLIALSDRYADDEENDHDEEAAIGGKYQNGGDINFYGGNITATSKSICKGAAIGGGGYSGAGSLKFYAGKYTIKSMTGYGAGIGGGVYAEASWKTGEPITIYGGEFDIFAYNTAGIGNGGHHDGSTGKIAIRGGKIKTVSRSGGAGIGAAHGCSNGPIEIYGGIISAAAYESDYPGAAIGAGGKASQGGYISISGGAVTALTTKGAGIGGGTEGNGGSVYISGGAVFANSSMGGAGIGGGYNGGNGGTVRITDGEVYATSACYDSTGELTDAAMEFYSNCDFEDAPEAGIAMAVVVGIVALVDLFTDNEHSGAGIGGGHKGSGGSVTITGGTVTARSGLTSASAIGRGKSGGTYGSVDIGNLMCVAAGENSLTLCTTANRATACRTNKWAVIEPCEHPERSYQCVDDEHHVIQCRYCAADKVPLNHRFDDDELICSDCGYERAKISFLPGDGSGEMADVYVRKGADYVLPDSTFTPPANKRFFGWLIPGSSENYPVGSELTINESITLTAQYTDPYNLWVGGVQVTSAICNDILGDGKVSYDPESCTLHFNNYTADMPGLYSNTLIYSQNINLTITGSAVLNRSQGFMNGINIRSGSLTIDGDFTLTGASANAVFAEKDIIIKSGTIVIKGENYGIRANRNLYIRKEITSVTSDATRYYSLYYGTLDMDASLVAIELSSESRALSYDRARHIVIVPGAVVTFKLNGGRWNGSADDVTKTVQNNTTVEKPDPDPTRSSYVFGGWYTDAALTTEFDFTQPVTEDTVLYAGWKRTYSVEMYWRKASESEAAPDSVDAVLQYETNGQWTTVDTVTLNAANSWKARFTPALFRDGDSNKYRIRELDKNGAVVPDKYDDNGEESPTAVFNVGGREKGYLVKYVKSSAMTEIINYSYIEYSVEKIWDTDRGNQDHPDDLDVVLQRKKNWYTWETVELLTLNAANNLSGKFKPVPVGDVNDDGEFVKFEYRIRELEAEDDDDDTGGQPAQPQTEEEKLEAANGRVVHDKWDFDKPILDSVLDKFKDPETYLHFEPDLDWVKDQAKDILIPSPSVEFEVDEYTDAYGVKIEKHTTKYNVKYELNNDKTKMKITDLAVLDVKVHSWWINFEETTDEETGETKSEKPEYCYVMLESKVDKDHREHVPEGEYLDIYTPCFSAVGGGYSLDKLPGVSDLKKGILDGVEKLMGGGFVGKIGKTALESFVDQKLGSYLKTGVAIAKQDGDATNPLNRWYTEFTVKKYGMGELKVPMDYAAAELVTGLIELVIDAAIKYFGIQNVHVPVMYQPIDEYWSVKGYEIDLSDTSMVCNIINTKFHGDDDNLGTVVSGMKYWKDDKEEDRPDSVSIHVYYKNESGEKIEVTGSPVTVQKPEGGGDSWPWSLEIPLGDDASQVDKDSFIIEEDSVSGYDSSVSGYDITNTKNTEPTEPSTDPPTDPDANKLRITAERSSDDADKEQSFVYHVSGPDNTTLTVAVVLEKGETSGSVTIAKLPAGAYTVTEERAWSWRFSDGGSESAQVGSSLAAVTFDHTKDNTEWLSGCSHHTND